MLTNTKSKCGCHYRVAFCHQHKVEVRQYPKHSSPKQRIQCRRIDHCDARLSTSETKLIAWDPAAGWDPCLEPEPTCDYVHSESGVC